MRKLNRVLFFRLISGLYFTFMVLSCSSIPPQKEWQGISMSSKNHWTLQVAAGNAAVLTLPFDGIAEVVGEAYEEENNSWVFYTDSLHLFFNWYDGWTETQIALQGVLRLYTDDTENWQVAIVEEPELGTVQKAEIRYRRNKINGDRAIDLMNRRLARSESVAAFIQNNISLSNYSFDHRKKGLYSEDFDEYLKQILFPEVYGYSNIYPRPEGQSDRDKRFVRQDETLWDTEYTSVYFPEELKDVRDSGTLFRDYEEASHLIYINCIWRELWGSIVPGSAIQEF